MFLLLSYSSLKHMNGPEEAILWHMLVYEYAYSKEMYLQSKAFVMKDVIVW